MTIDTLLAWERHWNGGGWGPPWWGIGAVLLLIVLGGLGVYLVRRRTKGEPAAAPQAAAEQVLATRFARGDIDEDEYVSRLSVLRGNQPPG